MKKKPDRVLGRCHRALGLVNDELAKREPDCGLPRGSLEQVKRELERMLEVMDSSVYLPAYGRFISDEPDVDEQLLSELLAASNDYRRYV